jgi:hypothetical protein
MGFEDVMKKLKVKDALVAELLAGGYEAFSGAGALSVNKLISQITTTGADALTLADGRYAGQLKVIKMVVDGGAGTLTPANLFGGTTLTFDDVGDYALLYFDGTEWQVIAATATLA